MRTFLVNLFAWLPTVAFAQSSAPLITRINPPSISTPTGYTHVVEVTGPNRTAYISGQVALDPTGKLVGAGDMNAQAEQAFKNLDAALAAIGAKPADVVKLNVYVIDMSKSQAYREARTRHF